MSVLDPGTQIARQHGCTCRHADQSSVIDEAVMAATGLAPYHATGLPQLQSDGCPYHGNHLQRERLVIVWGRTIGATCPPGSDYCWECGHVAPAEQFWQDNRCPNPQCPNPGNWND